LQSLSFVCLMVVNNIFAISWRSGLLVEETGWPGDNHRPVVSHWQTLSHNAVQLALIENRFKKNSYSKLKILEKVSVIFHQHDSGILNVFMFIYVVNDSAMYKSKQMCSLWPMIQHIFSYFHHLYVYFMFSCGKTIDRKY
jgi:hypothetical protein